MEIANKEIVPNEGEGGGVSVVVAKKHGSGRGFGNNSHVGRGERQDEVEIGAPIREDQAQF